MKRTILFVVVATLILSACSPTPNVDLGGKWKLISYGDAVNPIPALPNVDTTIQFENGQVSGNLGCNGFGGEYKLKGDKIIFGSLVSTMMYCEETSVQEQGVLTVFADGVELTLSMNGNALSIASPDGKSVVNIARK